MLVCLAFSAAMFSCICFFADVLTVTCVICDSVIHKRGCPANIEALLFDFKCHEAVI